MKLIRTSILQCIFSFRKGPCGTLLVVALLSFAIHGNAQVGEHRNDLAIGVNGGYLMSNVGFTPDVSQNYHGGVTGGLSVRYTCEKYFNTICSLYAELNYSALGWKENIVDINNKSAVYVQTGENMKYSRTINYVQVPLLAHLAWGKENKGFNFFLNLGPQFGYMLSESTNCNFDVQQELLNVKSETSTRSNTVMAQDTMSVENKFDYGIAGGIGLECSVPKVGHFLVEARYYYGLGNIFGSSKRDYFGKSNYGNVVVKASYLFDLMKTQK